MLSPLRWILCFLFLGLNLCFTQDTDWELADRNITRYSPDSFPQLPVAVRSYLKSEGYTIPQSYVITPGPHNVIQGHFRSMHHTDWAVLASKDQVSAILIFWNGSLRKVTSLAKEPDKNYLQKIDDRVIVFARLIEVIASQSIPEYYKSGSTKKKVMADHDGINDRFLEKTSAIHYYNAHRWHNFQGAD